MTVRTLPTSAAELYPDPPDCELSRTRAAYERLTELRVELERRQRSARAAGQAATDKLAAAAFGNDELDRLVADAVAHQAEADRLAAQLAVVRAALPQLRHRRSLLDHSRDADPVWHAHKARCRQIDRMWRDAHDVPIDDPFVQAGYDKQRALIERNLRGLVAQIADDSTSTRDTGSLRLRRRGH